MDTDSSIIFALIIFIVIIRWNYIKCNLFKCGYKIVKFIEVDSTNLVLLKGLN